MRTSKLWNMIEEYRYRPKYSEKYSKPEKFFKVTEDEMMKLIECQRAISLFEKKNRKTIKFMNSYLQEISECEVHEISEYMVRKGLITFLKTLNGNVNTLRKRNYELPIRYQGQEEHFRKDFWDYLKISNTS